MRCWARWRCWRRSSLNCTFSRGRLSNRLTFLSSLAPGALLLVILAGSGAAGTPQTTDVVSTGARVQAPPTGHRWPDHQTYVYDVEWRLWTAGTATLTMEPGPNGQQLVKGEANSQGFVSLLYTVRDRFESGFDPKTFCSTHVFKHSEEGLRKRETNIYFDYPRGKAVLDEKNLKSNEAKHAENEIPSCVSDVVTALYYVGTLPLQAGSNYTFPMNDGGKTQNVEVIVEAREQVKAPAGTFKAIRVQPTSATTPAKQRGKIWIWYSDDEARIPVQMKAKMFWGTLTFRLKQIQRQPAK